MRMFLTLLSVLSPTGTTSVLEKSNLFGNFPVSVIGVNKSDNGDFKSTSDDIKRVIDDTKSTSDDKKRVIADTKSNIDDIKRVINGQN